MIELIKEVHQCKIEKTKLQVQLEAQQQKEDINNIIKVIYQKSSITADQMSAVLDKAANAVVEASEKTEAHFRRTIKWHKVELVQAFHYNMAKMEDHFEDKISALNDKITLQKDFLHDKMIIELKAHKNEILNINKPHQKNMEEMAILQNIEKELEKKLSNIDIQKPPEQSPLKTPDEKFAEMPARKPLNCTANRTP